jgi:putative methyltransferase (TIGR04325 family)
MKDIKYYIKPFIPPIILDLRNRLRTFMSSSKSQEKCGFEGDYKSWEDAQKDSTGYDSREILDRVKNALLKVKKGEAVYERDSVIFDKVQYSWPLLAGLLRVTTDHNNYLGVLDFGGSLGSSYYQNREFLSGVRRLRWCIVEQPSFVEVGQQFFSNNDLVFYEDIHSCVQQEEINVILLSSVLPYLEKPHEMLREITGLGIEYIIVDRTPFLTDGRKDLLTVQHVPSFVYKASYPAWFFEKTGFLQIFLDNRYGLVAEFDGSDRVNIPGSVYKGFIFRKNVSLDTTNAE